MTILTPKRRVLTKAAKGQIRAMAEAWKAQTGASSTNGMMGLSIRAGMLLRHIEALAVAADAIPTGTVHVPDLAPGLIPGQYISTNGIAGFSVDLDGLLP